MFEFDDNVCVLPFKPIYLDNSGEIFCVVDNEDYEWANQWRWNPVYSKQKRKIYAKRSTRKNGKAISIYLHKEIVYRAYGMPPSDRHIIGDHKNGQSLNNRRHNLRWATPSENAKNLHGFYAQQMRLAFMTGDEERIYYGK